MTNRNDSGLFAHGDDDGIRLIAESDRGAMPHTEGAIEVGALGRREGTRGVLDAIATDDQAAVERHSDAWYRNANQIADFLSDANPRHWPRREMRAMMREEIHGRSSSTAA